MVAQLVGVHFTSMYITTLKIRMMTRNIKSAEYRTIRQNSKDKGIGTPYSRPVSAVAGSPVQPLPVGFGETRIQSTLSVIPEFNEDPPAVRCMSKVLEDRSFEESLPLTYSQSSTGCAGTNTTGRHK